MNYKLVKQTHEPVSLLKIPGRATTHAPRVCLNVDVGLCENIPDLVNPRLQFSVLEDGRGFVGLVRVHGGRVNAIAWGTRASHDTSFIHLPQFSRCVTLEVYFPVLPPPIKVEEEVTGVAKTTSGISH